MAIIRQQGYKLPVKKELVDILLKEMTGRPPMKNRLMAVCLLFQDPSYSPSQGGYHPVEIRLIPHDDHFYFDYITDLAYVGRVYPELEKELDFSWTQQYIFHAGLGDLPYREGCELFKLWQDNFISYWHMGVYTPTILWES